MTKIFNISTDDLVPVGSFAKKPENETYGDVDVLFNVKSLDVDENKALDFVYDKFVSLGYEAIKMKGFNQVSVGFPIEGDKDKGLAQIDFMLTTNMDWSKFSYSSSPTSRYKAAYATFLLSAIITESYKKVEKRDENGLVEEYSFISYRLPSGLFKVTKSHKRKKGRVKKTRPDIVSEKSGTASSIVKCFQRGHSSAPPHLAAIIYLTHNSPPDALRTIKREC